MKTREDCDEWVEGAEISGGGAEVRRRRRHSRDQYFESYFKVLILFSRHLRWFWLNFSSLMSSNSRRKTGKHTGKQEEFVP